MRSSFCFISALSAASAMHPWGDSVAASAGCVPPGICVPPQTKYSRVIPGPQPGQQWNINGGFCGAFSVQHAALAWGAWVSQDLVRKANRNQNIPHPAPWHGSTTLGYEVMPRNVAYTAAALRLNYDEWDYNLPSPQAPAFKRWLKMHLSGGNAIAWFPICKGDSHVCYPESCPNGGACDHVEPMYGIFSNHPLTDPNVYADDWILHASDQDYQPYYRKLDELDDTLAMNGNCAKAGSGFGRNEVRSLCSEPFLSPPLTYPPHPTPPVASRCTPASTPVSLTALP